MSPSGGDEGAPPGPVRGRSGRGAGPRRGHGQSPFCQVGGNVRMVGVDPDEAGPWRLAHHVLHRQADHPGGIEPGTDLQDEQGAVRGCVGEPPGQPLSGGQVGIVHELGADPDVRKDLGATVGAARQGLWIGHPAGVTVVGREDRVEERLAGPGVTAAGDGALQPAVVALRSEDPVRSETAAGEEGIDVGRHHPVVVLAHQVPQPAVERVGARGEADVVDMDGPVAPHHVLREGRTEQVARAQAEPVQRRQQLPEALGVAVVAARRSAQTGAGRDQHPVGLFQPRADRLARVCRDDTSRRHRRPSPLSPFPPRGRCPFLAPTANVGRHLRKCR